MRPRSATVLGLVTCALGACDPNIGTITLPAVGGATGSSTSAPRLVTSVSVTTAPRTTTTPRATAPMSTLTATAPSTSTPTTGFVTGLVANRRAKLDLLLAIDNSQSMQDKQAILINTIPNLVSRLVNPWCVATYPDGGTTTVAPDPVAGCATGTAQEFVPIRDIHIGVVTSSLGDLPLVTTTIRVREIRTIRSPKPTSRRSSTRSRRASTGKIR